MIRISIQDIRFMLGVLPLAPDMRELLEQVATERDKQVSDEVADKLRDICTERLDTHGFDEVYAPTVEGRELEALIDKLYIVKPGPD